jgi:hypothetical protein
VALNVKFMKKMYELEQRFSARNRDPDNFTRVRGNPASLEYTYLYPPSPGGLTSRGVPYSVSI